MSETTEMTKVVINECYGGFSLSDEAKRNYLRRRGMTWTEEPTQFSALMGPSFIVDGDPGWYDRDLSRTDPDLVAVVEEMGEAANGRCAYLVIRELPEGTHYVINEYDGNEWIQTRDGTEWDVA